MRRVSCRRSSGINCSCTAVWLLTTPDCTGQHRTSPDPHWTTPGPYRARNDWLFRFDDKLIGVRRANYPQLTKRMNSSQCSWWVDFKVGMDVFDVSCLFSWSQAPEIQEKCGHTPAKYFSASKTWTKTTTAVRFGSGAINSHTRCIEHNFFFNKQKCHLKHCNNCLLYTSDAADE